MASLEAIERRRISRRVAAARFRKLHKPEEDSAIQARLRRLAERMRKRHVTLDRQSDPVYADPCYWLLRRAGYDICSEDLRWTRRWVDRDRTVRELVDPLQCDVWLWWCSLPWRTRVSLSGASRYILRGLEPKQALTLTNPHFEQPERIPA